MPPTRKLKVFLCHASEDKPKVRELYKKLAAETWIQPWLDEEDLLAGQDFDLEIYKATRDADVIIICISKISIEKEGYVNKEIRRAKDIADEKPEGTIYTIPLRFDDCQPSFEYLKKLHWVDYFTQNAHEKLIKSLRVRAEVLQIQTSVGRDFIPTTKINEEASHATSVTYAEDLDLYKFIEIPATTEVPYSFAIGKYPVTNAQYARFLNSQDYGDETLWKGFLKFNEDCIQIGRWRNEGGDFYKENSKDEKLIPRYWSDENFGIANPENPVVGISWYEANAYCNWLMRNWNRLAESKANSSLRPKLMRLPLDTEWTIAAGGEIPKNRYPWDLAGKATTDIKEIVKRANISESNIGHTTPVNAYLRGASPYGVMDMSGNVWEWQANYKNMKEGWLGLRGGSWRGSEVIARVAIRYSRVNPHSWVNFIGFRVCASPLPNGRS